MGKRKRRSKVKAEGRGPNPVEDRGRDDGTADSSVVKDSSRTQTRNKKKKIRASPANKEKFVNSRESKKAVESSPRLSATAVVQARTRKKAASHPKEEGPSFQCGGDLGGKKVLAWNSAQEITALAELIKLTHAADDGQQASDISNINWEQLATSVGHRLDRNVTRTQIYEKARRLKERYVRIRTRVGKEGERPNSFTNDGEEEVYKLSEQIWGSPRGGIRSQPEEQKNDLLSSDSDKKKLCGMTDNVPDTAAEVEIPWSVIEKERTPPKIDRKDTMSRPSEPTKQGTTAAHMHPNLNSNLASHSMEGDAQKTLEFFHAEQQALLKQLEKSCATVLQDMQGKFLSMMNNSARGSQFFARMGVGGCVPPFDDINAQAPLSWDKLIDKCLMSTSTDKPTAFENLCEQWQQQRLQELKLTSMKLQLMLEDCKMEQEKLERQVFKS